jgi:hypothetical protein
MSGRITMKELRAEAKQRLSDCRGGKPLSKLRRDELLHFLECIDDIELASQYRTQEAERAARGRAARSKRKQWKPGTRRKEPEDYYPVVLQDEIEDDDSTFVTRRRKPPSAAGAARGAAAARARARARASGPSGGGHVTYREFVRQTLPKYRAQGHSNQDAMRAVARDWQRHKQSGAGLADDVSSIANKVAVGTALAGAVQPELAPILEPAAAVAKGVGWAAKLF